MSNLINQFGLLEKVVLMIEWLCLAQRSVNTSLTSGPKLRQHSIARCAVPQESLHHPQCVQQVHSWPWRTAETVKMSHKPSKQLSRSAGSPKQPSSHKPCFAYSRTLENHALGVNRRECQNIYDGNNYCVGWARRINSFLQLPSVAVAASPKQFQEAPWLSVLSHSCPQFVFSQRKKLAQATLLVKERW